jgi:2-keto-3-deoxy-L-rhamnonate aldolase RhmA
MNLKSSSKLSNVFYFKTFRKRLLNREKLVGIFLKSNAYQEIEVLGNTGLDFVILDAEHAPFDRGVLDTCLLAANAVKLPVIVRLQGSDPEYILSVLDMGAAGILVPHTKDAKMARKIVAASRYQKGKRGFSGSPRAAGYGSSNMSEYIRAADKSISVMCQIEDYDGVEQCKEIARIQGVDCLFIGRADITIAYNADSITDGKVISAVNRVIGVGKAEGCPIGIFLPNLSEVRHYAKAGVSLFVIGSDQSILMEGAEELANAFKKAFKGNGQNSK